MNAFNLAYIYMDGEKLSKSSEGEKKLNFIKKITNNENEKKNFLMSFIEKHKNYFSDNFICYCCCC
jgi:predicted RNA-binding protein with EMAP domain